MKPTPLVADIDRNFLMFLPADSTNLRSVLSYYSSNVLVNPEGDVHVSEEANQGLGTTSFLHTLFGIFFFIANQSEKHARSRPHDPQQVATISASSDQKSFSDINRSDIPWDPGEEQAAPSDVVFVTATTQSDSLEESFLHMLTTLLPDPGYFLAGGVAGAVSRTCTAPLDRLKVYLIAQTSVRDKTLSAVKSGAPLQAAKHATGPLVTATLELWRMGGIRSLFAGKDFVGIVD